MRLGETDILTGLLYRKPPPSTPPRPASRAPRASLPVAPLSSAKSPRRSLVSLPTSAASLSCCATPRTSVPASSLRSAYVYSQSFFPLSPGWLCYMDYVGLGSIWPSLAVPEWYCMGQSCRGRLISIPAWTSPYSCCSVY